VGQVRPPFAAEAFLDSAGVARRIVEYEKQWKIYSQGDSTKNVMYIQKGGVRLTVVNEVGKEAVVAVLGPGDFFGEGGMAGQPLRMGSATAINPASAPSTRYENPREESPRLWPKPA